MWRLVTLLAVLPFFLDDFDFDIVLWCWFLVLVIGCVVSYGMAPVLVSDKNKMLILVDS